MDIPTHIYELIVKLISKTDERKITWTPTSRENEYSASFSGSQVTVDAWTSPNTSGKKMVDFAVYNIDGMEIQRVTYSNTSTPQEYKVLIDLHTKIIKSITKADETFDSLFKDLDNL